MKKISSLHKKWLKDPAYRKEYEALEEEFALASAMIAARARAGLTQNQLAQLMETTQSTIARLESGKTLPSGKTLQKFADATGSRLKIIFEAQNGLRKKRRFRKLLEIA
jgi:transcriptional regulator with XRE-family HTH domain